MLKKIKFLLFQNTSARQTVAKNAFWLGVSNLGGRLLRAVVIIYSARVLGAAEWGIFTYATSLAALATVFADLGIGSILIREIAKSKDGEDIRRRLISTSFFLKIILLAISVVGIFFLAATFSARESIKAIMPIIVFILAFDTIREFGSSLIRALEKMEWEAGLYLLTNVAIVVFGFIFLIVSPSVISFAYSYALGTGIGAAATVFVLRKDFKGIFGGWSGELARRILSSGWPFAIAAIMGVLMIDTDVIIIGWLRSIEEVGLYSAAQRIVQLLYLFPSIIAVSLLPTFSRLAAKGDGKMRFLLERGVSAVYLIAIPLVVGGIIVGGETIELLFGGGFSGATLAFQILLTTILVNFPAVIFSSLIFAYDKQKYLMVYAAIGGISNVILDILLIPRWGIAGSAAATLIAQILSNIYIWLVAKNILQFKILPHLPRAMLAATIMGACVFAAKALGTPVLITIVLGAVIYLVSLLFLREPLFNEIRPILRSSSSTAPEKSEPSSL